MKIIRRLRSQFKPTLETLKVSFDAINANRTRATLTMLGVIIGVAAVILLVSIGAGLQDYITERFESLGSNLLFVMPGTIEFEGGMAGADPSVAFAKNQLSEREVSNIRQLVPEVKVVSPEYTFNEIAKYQGRSELVVIIGTDEFYSEARSFNSERGRMLTKNDVRSTARIGVVGKTIIKNFYNRKDPVGTTITIGGKKFEIVGTYAEKGRVGGSDMDNMIIIPYTAAQKYFGLDKFADFNVKIKEDADPERAVRSIEQALLRTLEREDFTVMTSKDLLGAITGILGTLTVALAGIAAISLLVGGVGIMNIMLVSVTERTREIGLRKAVGATPQNILWQFLVESILLSTSGGIIGILLGIGGSLALRQLLTTTVAWWSVAIAFGFSLLVGIVFGTYPASQAAKKDPIEALRYK